MLNTRDQKLRDGEKANALYNGHQRETGGEGCSVLDTRGLRIVREKEGMTIVHNEHWE